MRIWFVLILSFISRSAWAAYGDVHREAYDLVISMEIDKAIEVISAYKKQNPDDVLIYHIENYIDFITLFISEDEEAFREKEQNKKIRLKKLKSGNPESPYYLFSQAEVLLQWALTRVKFEEYFTAALEVNRAIGLLEKNSRLFPDFVSNKKSLSILHAVAGTIPDKYKGIISLVSNFEGSIHEGLNEVNALLAETDSSYMFHKEAVAIKTMILLHLKNEKEKAWQFLSSSELSKKKDPMSTFLLASTAIHSGKNDLALGYLKKRIRSPRYYPFYYLDLMEGSTKLARLEKDADVYMQSYIRNFKGQDYFKDAYRKLAWHSLIVLEDEEKYRHYMQRCLETGRTDVDEDQSAYQEALKNTIPNIHLLKARVLFDGGYNHKALNILEEINITALDELQRMEYGYRKGRIYQNLNQQDEALEMFLNCLNSDSDSHTYFACNAALQIGNIYEKKGQKSDARKYYKICLNLHPDEYKNSLHQKAKAGLKRL